MPDLAHVSVGTVLTQAEWEGAAHDIPGGAAGDMLYYNGTVVTSLTIGVAGYVLRVNGAATAPEWVSFSTAVSWPLHAPADSAAAPSYSWSADQNTGFYKTGVGTVDLSIAGTRLFAWNNATFYILSNSASISLGAAQDVNLARDAANVLAQRNSTSAQAWRIYNTYTDVNNWERGTIAWSGNNLLFLTEQLGTGSARIMVIGTVGGAALRFQTNNTIRWNVDSSGHLTAEADNTYDIGASAATRPRNIYAGTSVVAAAAFQVGAGNAILFSGTTLQIGNSGNWSSGMGLYAGTTLVSSLTTTAFTNAVPFVAPVGSAGAPSYTWTGDLNTGWYRAGADDMRASSGGADVMRIAASDSIIITAAGKLQWGSSGVGSADLSLVRDAANTLAQRNGVSAQTHHLYATYTDASNYERLSFYTDAGGGIIRTEQAGTGVARALTLGTGIAGRWQITAVGHLLAVTDNVYDIGASGATRPRNLYVGSTIVAPRVALAASADANRSVTDPTNAMNVFNGTAPAGTLANGATFYAAAGEMWVMDAGGTPTQLSPHDPDGYWWFNSRTRAGKKLEIDVEKILRYVNDKYGLNMVRELEEACRA